MGQQVDSLTVDDKTVAAKALSSSLPPGHPNLVAAYRALDGHPADPVEQFETLKQIGEAVGYHVTWLHRLGVQRACGHKLAGNYRYRRSEVLAWLSSPDCHLRVVEIAAERKRERQQTAAEVTG